MFSPSSSRTRRATSKNPPTGTPGDYSAARGKKLGDKAYALHHGHASGNYCLKGVRESVVQSGIVPSPPGWTPSQPDAYSWGKWAKAHPAELTKRGFRYAPGVSVNAIPQGAIIVWQPGQCGYHRQYGHIEIVTDTQSSQACSDFCGKVKKTCNDPWVFIPTTL